MKRIIALWVCALMLVGVLPTFAFAAEETNPLGGTEPASPSDVYYKVTVNSDGNGTASASCGSGLKGTIVTLTATANPGYRFKAWQVNSGAVSISNNQFTIGESDVAITAIFEKDPNAVYSVIVGDNGYGTASANPTSGATGTKVKLTATPMDGYALAGWQVDAGNVTISNNEFVIGEEDVAVKAIFMPVDTQTKIDISVSTGSITYGETLEIYVSPETAAKARAATFGKLTLTVNGCFTLSTDVTALPFTWRIPVTGQYGFSTGTNTVAVTHTRSDGSSSADSAVVKVTKPCRPAPCPPSHYCCGHEHYNGKCVTVRAGEDVTFKVELECNETCQWYVDKGCGFVKIEGATCPSITVKDVTHKQDGYRYRCIIRNCCETTGNPIFTLNVASGQLYSPKTGDGSVLMTAIAAAVAACGLIQRKREN